MWVNGLLVSTARAFKISLSASANIIHTNKYGILPVFNRSWYASNSRTTFLSRVMIITCGRTRSFFRYKSYKERMARMYVTQRYDPVFVEPNMKEYEVQVRFACPWSTQPETTVRTDRRASVLFFFPAQVLQMSVPIDDNDSYNDLQLDFSRKNHTFSLDNVGYITKENVDSIGKKQSRYCVTTTIPAPESRVVGGEEYGSRWLIVFPDGLRRERPPPHRRTVINYIIVHARGSNPGPNSESAPDPTASEHAISSIIAWHDTGTRATDSPQATHVRSAGVTVFVRPAALRFVVLVWSSACLRNKHTHALIGRG